MPDFEVTSPEGKRFIVTAPEGASQDAVLSFAQSQFGQQKPPSMGDVALNAIPKALAAIPDAVINTPTRLYNLGKAAYGTAAYALGYKDVGDSITMSEEPNIVNKALHKPVLEVNGKSAVGPLIRESNEPQTPGQRVVDAAVQGGTAFLLAPGNSVAQVAKNVALGTTSGATAQATKEATGSPAAAIAVGMLTPLAVRHALNGFGKSATNEVLGETVKDGMAAGYVVPPSAIKKNLVLDNIESVGGKAAVRQEAALRNQEVTNKLAAKAIGLPDDTTLTVGKLEQIREQAGQAYQDVAGLPGVPAAVHQSVERGKKAYDKGFVTLDKPKDNVAVIAELRQVRNDASVYYKHYERTADPQSQKLGDAAWKRANELEGTLEQSAALAGKPELVAQLREARQLIARTYDVERALNVGDGNVSAAIIGRALDNGKPLSGELKTIGRFAQAFPAVTRDAASVPSPGVSALNPVASAALSLGTFAATGGAGAAAVAGGLPLLRGPARSYLLSKGVQNRLVNPPEVGDTLLRSGLAGIAAGK